MATKKTKEQLIDEFKQIHGTKYDYTNVIYKNMHTQIEIKCDIHGSFMQQPRAHKNGQGCPKCNISINWVPKRDTESFINRAKEIHGDKYDYSRTLYIKTMDKVIIICPKHGEFKQLANSHLNGRGCPHCAGNLIKTTEEFINEAYSIHNDIYDYSNTTYCNASKKITIICRKHGQFEQKPIQHLSGQGCPQCGIESMKTELQKDQETFIKECSIIHNNKYDYSNTTYSGKNNKITIICKPHGAFTQKASEHLRGSGCPKCAGNQTLTTTEFKEKSNTTHKNRYTYNRAIYTGSKNNITITCEKHGNFTIQAGYHMHGGGCPSCAISTQQHEIYEFIQATTNEEIKLNDRTIISPYELDIAIPSKKFAIEFNGNFFHSYNNIESEDRLRHSKKADMADENNITLIQINSHEWKLSKELVKSMISHRLGNTQFKIYARTCSIRQIADNNISDFFDSNHISHHRPAKVNYGLYYDNNLLSAINFNMIGNNSWEIIRYATDKNTMIVGGLSKLLAAFISEYKPYEIMTFVDRRYGNGKGYLNAGFKLVGKTKPGYIYLDSNCNPAGSRFKFQKHKLSDILPNFDNNLTEAENMFNNGYRRMWDAGHFKMMRTIGH